MRAIDAAEHAVAIDPQRVSIWGASMGGQGACTIGLHRPDNFAFVASYFGDAKFDLVDVRPQHPADGRSRASREPGRRDRQRAARPDWLIHGDADRTSNVHESDDLAAALRQRSYAVTYDRVPGRGHEGLLVVEHIAEIVAAASHAQVPLHPARVTFRSVRRRGRSRVRREASFARVPATRSSTSSDVGDRVVVHAADGVRAIVLEDGALGASKGASVAWDRAHPNVEVRFE